MNKLKDFKYKLIMFVGKYLKLNKKMSNTKENQAPVSFYSLSATLNNGKEFTFESLKGKNVLIVNLASACGYTPQYEDLEKLYQAYKGKLEILGFPCNQFGAQEQGSDEEIATFCKVNFGVTFPLFKKADVKGSEQQPVYKWLTDTALNGWNSQEPTWNFYKYFIDTNGELQTTMASGVAPFDEALTQLIK